MLTPPSGKVLLALYCLQRDGQHLFSPCSFTIPLGNHKNSLHRPRRRTSFSRAPPPELRLSAPFGRRVASNRQKGQRLLPPLITHTFHPKTTLILKSSMMGLTILDTWLAGTAAHASCTKHAGVTCQRTVWATGKTYSWYTNAMLIDRGRAASPPSAWHWKAAPSIKANLATSEARP